MFQNKYYTNSDNEKIYPSNLIDDYLQNKINNLPDCKDNFIWSLEYAYNNENIYCFGIEHESGKHVKLKINIEAGLFLFAHTVENIEMIKNILEPQQEIIVYDLKFKNSNKTYLDTVFDTSKNKDMVLFKITTKSFEESKRLYYIMRSTLCFNNAFELTHKWSIEMFLYIYQMVLFKNKHGVSLISTWINNDLFVQKEHKSKPEALNNMLYFDIETISSDPVRVPNGSCVDDLLFSVSLLFCHEGKIECKCLILLPIDKDVADKYIEQITHDDLQKQYGHIIHNRSIEIYNSEIDLLMRMYDLMLDPYKGQFFYCVGFNSNNYDMSFIFYRSLHYHKLYKYYKQFKFQIMCLTFGLNMYHVDLQMFLKKYYKEGNSFSLKTFSTTILDAETKEDVNPVTFRYLFVDVYKNKHDIIKLFTYSNSSSYTLSKVILYNDIDSILLFRLWGASFVKNTIDETTNKHIMPVHRLIYAESGEFLEMYMINSILCDSDYFMVYTENETTIDTPYDSYLTFNKSESIKSIKKSLNTNNSYDGGLNCVYCGYYGESYSLDFVTYYTKQLDGYNVSHETSMCLTFEHVMALYNMGLHFENCIFFMFHSHKSEKETDVTVYNFLNGLENNDCFSIKEIIENKYKFKKNQRLVLIYIGERGFLSTYAKKQNELRSSVKDQKKCVRTYYENVFDIIVNKQNNIHHYDDDDDDEDEEDMFQNSDDDDDNDDVETNSAIVEKTSNDINIEMLMADKLKKLTIDELKIIAEQANAEIQRLEAHDRSLKIYNSSLYGFLGSHGSVMRAKYIAAIVTFLGRRNIIETAKIVLKYGGIVLMIDTDGLIMKNKLHEDTHLKVIKYMLNENPCLELSAKKYNMTLVLSKKVYITKNDSNEYSSRGINKFGPHCWNQILYMAIEEYYTHKKGNITKQTIIETIHKIYQFVYNIIKQDHSVAIITRKIKELSEYKKNSDTTKLLKYMIEKNANVTLSKSVDFFFLLNENKPNDTILAPKEELGVEYDHTRVNIFKFISKIHKPLYKIISKAFMQDTHKNEGIFVILSERKFKSLMLTEYMSFISNNKPTMKRKATRDILSGNEKITKINNEIFKHDTFAVVNSDNDSDDDDDFFSY